MIDRKETSDRLHKADLFLFMGQSNMAGRGESCERFPDPAPPLKKGAGYEYRAVTDPDNLIPIKEPFGRDENRAEGIDDGDRKTGSMVTAFVNSYYQCTGVPIIGVSASKGGSSILQWQPDKKFFADVKERLSSCRRYLRNEEISILHTCLLWCQGETDGDKGMTGRMYQHYFMQFWEELKLQGIEHCFFILIGNYNGSEEISYQEIQTIQRKLTETVPEIILADESFPAMKERGLMKDSFHYYQKAYNEVGTNAGRKVAHILYGK